MDVQTDKLNLNVKRLLKMQEVLFVEIVNIGKRKQNFFNEILHTKYQKVKEYGI